MSDQQGAVSHATHWWFRWKDCHVRSRTLRGARVCGKALGWPRLSVGLRVRAISLFGTRVVWSRETELPSLLLCPVTRAGEISLATRGGSERNLLPLFTLRNDRVCSNFRAFPPRPSLALFVVYAVFTAVFTQLSWLRKISLPLSLSLTLR